MTTTLPAEAARRKLPVKTARLTPESESWGYLEFRIEKVHLAQKPAAGSPGYEAGGAWTFLDCAAGGSAATVRFTVGLEEKKAFDAGPIPVRIGHAMIWAPDRSAGRAFLSLFASAFHGAVPPEQKASPIDRIPFPAALFGQGQRSDGPGQGFTGNDGPWTITKWFPSADGREAEVFFNYNLDGMEGEFSEKDPEYRRELLDIFAIILRDGVE